MSIPSDVFGWIAPGEIRYCNCGVCLVDPEKPELCDACFNRSRLEDFACGVCGAPSWMMSVHGFRCRAHEFFHEPSEAVVSEGLVRTGGRLLRQRSRSERTQTQDDHAARVKAITELAASRKAAGVPEKFWLQNP